MRICILIVVCFYMISGKAYAQIRNGKSGVIKVADTVPNTFYKDIFIDHPNLERISVELIEQEPVWLTLYFQSDSLPSGYREHFDLKFEGDRHIFAKKYRPHLPVLPENQLIYMASICQCDRTYRLKANIHADSVVYSLLQYCPPHKEWIDFRSFRVMPVYKEGIDQLVKRLEKDFIKSEQLIVGDSVLVFQVVVERDGTLGDVQLVVGETSPFAQLILERIQETSTSWWPAIQGGRPVRVGVKFYTRLNKDGRITVLTNASPYR